MSLFYQISDISQLYDYENISIILRRSALSLIFLLFFCQFVKLMKNTLRVWKHEMQNDFSVEIKLFIFIVITSRRTNKRFSLKNMRGDEPSFFRPFERAPSLYSSLDTKHTVIRYTRFNTATQPVASQPTGQVFHLFALLLRAPA